MGFSRAVKRIRRRLQPRLIYSPFLRLILFNKWFQLGFGAFALVILAGVMYFPKMWKVSPPGFLPEIRISLLDMTQNWSLKRSARKFERLGDFTRASRSWEGAVSQSPADASALRGFLENCIHIARPDKRTTSAAAAQMPWLWRLCATNQQDIELVARVCEHLNWGELLTHWLAPIANSLPPRAELACTKAFFREENIREFRKHLVRCEGLADPELALYRIAYEAGWGHPAEAAAADQKLQAACAVPDALNTLAQRLEMMVARHKHIPERYRAALDRLAARDEATVADHAALWELLAASGDKKTAALLAERYTSSPSSGAELLRLARGFVAAGLSGRAIELMERFAPAYSQAAIWNAYGALLAQEHEWERLRGVALRMREDPGTRTTLWGLSYLLEGRADLEQRLTDAAEMAFRHAAESQYDLYAIALEVAAELTRVKHPELAVKILDPIEAAHQGDLMFWQTAFDAALAMQDHERVLKSAARCYELNPEDPAICNRYAAALIVNRAEPEHAIEFTVQLLAKFPASPSTIINHSCALLLNGRAAEGRKLLGRLNPGALGPGERTAYYLALFEACFDLGEWDQAWKASDHITVSGLFPIQRKWLEEKRRKMPMRVAATH